MRALYYVNFIYIGLYAFFRLSLSPSLFVTFFVVFIVVAAAMIYGNEITLHKSIDMHF